MTSDTLVAFILKDEQLSRNLLVRAVREKNMEIIEKLVDSLPSIDEKKRDDIIWAVIHVTISELTSEVFEMLIKNGPSTYYTPRKPRNFYDFYERYYNLNCNLSLNLLYRCIIKKRNDLLRKLLEKYDIDLIAETYHRYDWHNGEPYLYVALMSNNYNGAKLLMEYGADINQMYKIFSESKIVCYEVLRHKSKIEWKLIEFMLNHGADLSDSEKLRLCCKDESIIKKVEDFYREPKKRAKPLFFEEEESQ